MKKTLLFLIRQVWFWAGIIFVISTIFLLTTFFSEKVFINNTYNGLCSYDVCVGGGEDFGIELHEDNYATVYRGSSRLSIPCSYSIKGNTLTLRSTPEWDRAYESYEKTFIIKDRFTLLCEEKGHKWKADYEILIYIGQAMGISGLIFIASGIDSIKKHIKNKKQIKASE